MRSGLNVNNNVSNTQAQEATESTVPNRNETIDPPYLSTDLNLLKQNGFIETEDQSLNNILPDDKNITEQSTLNENTEKQINNTVSALASQNVLLPKPGKRSKVTAQVYFAPTVSYRKLTRK